MIDIEIIQNAINLTLQGKFDEAEKIYNELYEAHPDDYNLLSVIGLFYINRQNYKKASEFLEKACNIKETLGTLSSLAFSYYEQDKYTSAIKFFKKALTYGHNIDIYHKLINSLIALNDNKEALKYTEEMSKYYPDHIKTIKCKVSSWMHNGRLMEAKDLCLETLKKDPKISASLWTNLGFLTELIYRDDRQAIEYYKVAAELGDEYSSFYNIAVGYMKLGEYENAEKYLEKCLAFGIDDSTVTASYGMCKLAQKKFREGYELFCKRGIEESYYTPKDELPDEVIVSVDQGIGDNLQFIRYMPLLEKKVKKIKFYCYDALKDLFQRNYPQYEYITQEDIPSGTKVIRLTDLAYILDIDFDNIPYSEGYLDIEPAAIKSDKKLKVGVCWEAGSAAIRGFINRTIPAKCLDTIMHLDNVEYYSLVKKDTLNGCELYPHMIPIGKAFSDFTDTARAVKAMDIIITVDTSVAHLCGALGVKTLFLLPYATDWRWFDDTKTTPWYDSFEIFKQTNPLSWEDQMIAIKERLMSF